MHCLKLQQVTAGDPIQFHNLSALLRPACRILLYMAALFLPSSIWVKLFAMNKSSGRVLASLLGCACYIISYICQYPSDRYNPCCHRHINDPGYQQQKQTCRVVLKGWNLNNSGEFHTTWEQMTLKRGLEHFKKRLQFLLAAYSSRFIFSKPKQGHCYCWKTCYCFVD